MLLRLPNNEEAAALLGKLLECGWGLGEFLVLAASARDARNLAARVEVLFPYSTWVDEAGGKTLVINNTRLSFREVGDGTRHRGGRPGNHLIIVTDRVPAAALENAAWGFFSMPVEETGEVRKVVVSREVNVAAGSLEVRGDTPYGVEVKLDNVPVPCVKSVKVELSCEEAAVATITLLPMKGVGR